MRSFILQFGPCEFGTRLECKRTDATTGSDLGPIYYTDEQMEFLLPRWTNNPRAYCLTEENLRDINTTIELLGWIS